MGRSECGAPERAAFLKRSGREEPDLFVRRGKKLLAKVLKGGALPIGLIATRREIGPANREKERLKAPIGHVTKNDDGGYKGQLRTVSNRAEIDIIPNRNRPRKPLSIPRPDSGVEIYPGRVVTARTTARTM